MQCFGFSFRGVYFIDKVGAGKKLIEFGKKLGYVNMKTRERSYSVQLGEILTKVDYPYREKVKVQLIELAISV